MLELEIQKVAKCEGPVPAESEIKSWVLAALADDATARLLVIRLVDEGEARALNEAYRGIERATNVLSFPAALDPQTRELLQGQGAALPMGDLVLCCPLVLKEAREQGKSAQAHLAHLIVHGVLHLSGYDHEEAGEAAQMEAEETRILAHLGFPDPYL